MMHHMQNVGTSGGSFPMLFGIHGLGMILLGVGIAFLIVWGVRNLSAAKLKIWGIGITTLGAFLTVLTMSSVHPAFGGKMGKGGSCGMMKEGGMMMNGKMDMEDGKMMKHDDPMAMSMHDMAGMLEGKSGDDFDRAFLEGMIPHHQGAIDMAKGAEEFAKHAEIKKMSKDIMTTQQREIDQMNQWLKDWGYTK